MATAASFQEHLLEALERRPTHVILHLGGVTFLASAGISALLEVHRRAEELGCAFAIGTVSPFVRRVIDVTGVGWTLGL